MLSPQRNSLQGGGHVGKIFNFPTFITPCIHTNTKPVIHLLVFTYRCTHILVEWPDPFKLFTHTLHPQDIPYTLPVSRSMNAPYSLLFLPSTFQPSSLRHLSGSHIPSFPEAAVGICKTCERVYLSQMT